MIKKTDLHAHIEGPSPIKKNIKTYRALRIGQVAGLTNKNLLDQIDKDKRPLINQLAQLVKNGAKMKEGVKSEACW